MDKMELAYGKLTTQKSGTKTTAVKNACKHKPTRHQFSSCSDTCFIPSCRVCVSSMLLSLVKTRLCARWNFSHFDSVTRLCHSAGFKTADFSSE